jgi:plastocyanin
MMKRSIGSLLVLVTPFVLTFCNDNNANEVTPLTNGTVDIFDACDPVTFNGALGEGTCTQLPTVATITLDDFEAQLTAQKTVPEWRFDPTTIVITAGGTVTATNLGGEKHTFTEVAHFGGGILPALNQASGNPVEAPECAALKDTALIAPEASFTTAHILGNGSHNFQCCIHPWMRATVTAQ